MLAIAAATCLALGGCGDTTASDPTSTAASTTIRATTAASDSPSPQPSGPSAADRKDAKQAIGRIEDGLNGLNRYVADFYEIAPVRADEGDVDGARQDAQTVIASLGLIKGVLAFDSPAEAQGEQAALQHAIEAANRRLEAVGSGPDTVAEVDQAKRALQEIQVTAGALTRRLKQIARR